MRLSGPSPLPTSGRGFDWIDIGEVPRSVTDPTEARRARVFRWLSPISAVVFGLVIGYLVLQQIAPGFPTWPPGGRIETWIGVGVPAGLADYIITRWYFSFLTKATMLRARRVSVVNGELHVDLVGRPALNVPIRRVVLSESPVGEGWFRVSIPTGRFVPSFYVPGNVASMLAQELGNRA